MSRSLTSGKLPTTPSDHSFESFEKELNRLVEAFGKRIVREPVPINKDEPLKLELQHFVKCVNEKLTPAVSGESAKQALDLAFEITRQIKANP